MLLIPEISTVLILPPRTGSSSLRKAVLRTYPEAMQIYRHMEADGIPLGYDTWRRIGLVRNPVDRLWSLYKFMKNFGNGPHDPAFVNTIRSSVERPFSDWIVNNNIVFTSPYDSAGKGRFWPQYSVRHPIPENRKSQAIYLRPDLGTQYYPFEHIQHLAAELGIVLDLMENRTEPTPPPELTEEAAEYVARVHDWDCRVTFTDVARYLDAGNAVPTT